VKDNVYTNEKYIHILYDKSDDYLKRIVYH